MKNDILIPLLNNAVLLLALATVYDLLTIRKPGRKNRILRKIETGIALGGLGIGLILASVRLAPGIVFDTRSVLLSVSGLFFGPGPTVIAMAMTAAFRLLQGGTAACAGTAVIIATGSIGLIWSRWRKKPLEQVSAGELYVFGIVNHIVMLALMLIMPLETALHILSRISGPVLLIYPAVTVALGLLLTGRLRRLRTAEALTESEATYRNLFQNNHAVMLLIDPKNGNIVDANPAACRFYGWTAGELRRMKITQINTLPPEKTQAEIENAKTGRRNFFHFRHRLADGSIRDVETLSGPVTIGGQKLLYSIIHDITERHRTEAERSKLLNEAKMARQALLSVIEDQKRTEGKLRLTRFALDHSADSAFWVNPDGTFADVNEAACKALGYSKEELLKLAVKDIDPDFPKERWQNHWQEIKEKGSLVCETRHRSKDGHIFPVEIRAKYMKFEGREYNFAFAHDITKRKQLQEAIEKRIVSLTRPLNQSGAVAFEDLFDLKEIQRIQDEFAAATGVASIITCPDGTPVTEPSNFTCLCSDIIRKTKKGCSNCFKSDAALGRHHPEGPIIQPCLSGGLWDAGVSITVGGQHIANWLIGQVRDETQTDEPMRAYAHAIGADEQKFMDAFYNVPVMSLEHFRQVAQALFTLANQLSTTAYLNLQQARFIADEKRRSEELQRLSTAIEQSPEAVLITNPEGIIQYVNPAFETITGYPPQEAVGKTPRLLKSGQHDDAFYSGVWKTIRDGRTWEGRFVNKHKNGTLYTEESSISPVRDPSGAITGYVAVSRDITEELQKEEQFRQSQKMEAIGQLAGGVAHDFNNILQAILGFSEILLSRLAKDSTEHRNVLEIQKAARRAAEMTRHLLAFSRKQPMDKKRIDINAAIRDFEVLLMLLLGEKIKCSLELEPSLHQVYADHSQITQIVMNLVVNARDAMPDGGHLTITTENITFEPQTAAAMPGAEPGSFVCLSVTDTGCGMSREAKDHLFEPFFTTKDVGQGTGLGLAVIYGIVKQNKGWIHVYSEEGKGTAFKIYLPVCEAAPPAGQTDPISNERILLVEDDADTRNLVIRILNSSGYETVAVASAEEAFELFKREEGRFDLLFSDMTLPGTGGLELADKLREENPGLPILLYSGYQDQRERWNNIESKGYLFLQKPFSAAGLLTAVHDSLKTQPGNKV